MAAESPVPRTVSRVDEPPMYLQRPSSGRSQSVGHVIVKTFREVLGKEMIGPETIHNLTVSKGSPDEYHDRYVSALQKVEERRVRRCSDIEAVERHILKAQAKATSADERELNRITNLSDGYTDIGLPPAPAHFSAVVNQPLLQRHNLIAPDDYVSRFLPPVPVPSMPSEPNYARATTSSSTRHRSGRDSSAPSDVSGIIDYDLHLGSQCTSQESLVTSPRKMREGKPENMLWKSNLRQEERQEERKTLSNLEAKTNFLKNPRFEPSTQSQIFLAKPRQVVFRDYKIGQVYELPLELKNLTPYLQTLRVIPPKTSYFSMSLGQFPSQVGSVAAGLSCAYRLRFIPDSLCDYDDEITVQTTAGDMVVPVLGRRQPPVLSIPDVLDVGYCLVKGCRTVNFVIKNTGGRGSFSIMSREVWPATNFKSVIKPNGVDVDPFFITPSVIELNQNQSTVIQVTFRPPSVKQYNRAITIVCDNCHVHHVTLTGQGQVAGVKFMDVDGGTAEHALGELKDISATKLIRFDSLHPFTFTQKRLRVKNITNVKLPYTWRIVKPEIACPDPTSGSDPSASVEEPEDNDDEDSNSNPRVRVVDPESVFTVEPVSGVMEPEEEIETTVTFAPPLLGEFHRCLHLVMNEIPDVVDAQSEEHALLDVAGLEIEVKGQSRPLSVTVEPYGVFVPGKMLVGTTIRKPIQLTNHSLTPVIYQWEPVTSGPIIEVELPIGEIGPGESEVLYVSITGAEPGKIKETLKCYIENKEEPIYLFVEADVKGPEVVIEEPDLNFGLVRLGHVVTTQIHLQNLANMPARWSLQESPTSASLDDDMVESLESSLAVSELRFFPDFGELRPLETRAVHVEFTPVCCRSVKTLIELSVEDGNESTLHVMAEVQTPKACLLSCQLLLSDVYHNVPTSQTVTIYNQSMLPTSFKWLQVDGSQSSDCTVVMEPSFGYLGPREERQVTVTFTAHAQQEFSDVRIGCQIEGMDDPLCLTLMAEVKGLNVCYEALDESGSPRMDLSMDLGRCKLLEPVSRTLILRNTSAIQTKYRFSVQHFTARPPTPPQICAAPMVKTGRKCMLRRRPNLADPSSKTPPKALIEMCQFMLRSGLGAAFSIEPDSGVLAAFGEEKITVTAYSDMWGTYSDTIVAEVDSLAPVHIPVTVQASGCPLAFQIAASGQTTPCLRFGAHVSGVDPITRPVKVNNSSPYDIRLDWETYNVIPGDQKLIDLVVTYGKQFPLRDENGREIVPNDPPAAVVRRGTMSESPFTTPGFSRAPTMTTQHTQSETINFPKLISLKLRGHEGHRANQPYTASPSQLIIPAKHHNTVNIVFTPPDVEGDAECTSFVLGHLSIDHQVKESTGVVREDGLNVDPLRVDMFAHIKPAKLTIELDDDDDDGVISFTSALSDLLNDGQLCSDAVRSSRCLLHNHTAARLTFSLSTHQPFTLLSPAATSIHHPQIVHDLLLLPKHTLEVQVGFCINMDMLQALDNLEEGEESDGIKWTQSSTGERRLHYTDQLDILFNNGTKQTIPLRATLSLPSLNLSTELVDFGTCFVDQERQIDVFVSNTTASDSHWRLELESSSGESGHEAFTVSPVSGQVDAHVTHSNRSKTAVKISFLARHEADYEAVYVLRGMLGEDERTLTIKGRGSLDGAHEIVMA